MEINLRSVSELIPYARNPRKNDLAVDSVAASIKEFGFKQPIVVDADNVIVVGHTRLRAAKKLGILEVPVIVATDLTPDQIKAYRILDNKLNEKAEWDGELLGLELSEIEMDLAPFDVDFEDDVRESAAAVEQDEPPPFEDAANSERGDVWILGEHRLACADSKDPAAVRACVGGALRLIVTDPPYGVSYVGKTNEALTIENDSLNEEQLRELWAAVLDAWIPELTPGGGLYATVPARPLNLIFAGELQRREILRQQLVWAKDSMVLGRSDYHYQHEPILYGWRPDAAHYFTGDRTKVSVIEVARPKASREHPTMKPTELWAQLIQNSSKKDELVGDPFSGSGTTIIACEQTGRKARAAEIDPHYCDVAVRRWQNFTGRDAVLESSGESFSQIEQNRE